MNRDTDTDLTDIDPVYGSFSSELFNKLSLLLQLLELSFVWKHHFLILFFQLAENKTFKQLFVFTQDL